MAWPTHNHNDNFRTPEPGYPWSTIDLDGWRTDFFIKSQALYMSPSPEPPTTTSSSTATSYTHELQLPSTPDSLGRVASPSLVYSDQSGTNESTKEIDLEPFLLKRDDAVIPSASSCEPVYPSLWDDLEAIPRQNSTTIQSNGSSNSCAAKPQTPRYSRLPSSKNKNDNKYGTFKCEWEGCRYDRMFSRKGVLMRHIEMQHVNPRSFKCPWCSHATSRRENLKAHRQAIHQERL